MEQEEFRHHGECSRCGAESALSDDLLCRVCVQEDHDEHDEDVQSHNGHVARCARCGGSTVHDQVWTDRGLCGPCAETEAVFGPPPPPGTAVKTTLKDPLAGYTKRALRCPVCREKNDAWRTHCRVCGRLL
jgi:DNA-directed RNA polymerase subunit M/transcription elongation factor TFIIS